MESSLRGRKVDSLSNEEIRRGVRENRSGRIRHGIDEESNVAHFNRCSFLRSQDINPVLSEGSGIVSESEDLVLVLSSEADSLLSVQNCPVLAVVRSTQSPRGRLTRIDASRGSHSVSIDELAATIVEGDCVVGRNGHRRPLGTKIVIEGHVHRFATDIASVVGVVGTTEATNTRGCDKRKETSKFVVSLRLLRKMNFNGKLENGLCELSNRKRNSSECSTFHCLRARRR